MGKCGGLFREEFRARHFLLGHDTPQTFVQFQCGRQTAYLCWRVFWALFHTGWIIASGVRADLWAGEDSSQYIKWFIYLTDWAYFMLTLSTVVDALVVGYVFLRRQDIREGNSEVMPWYLRADWVLTTTANAGSVTVSIAYWAIVYKSYLPITSIDVATHIVNSIYVIVNICVSGMLVRIMHFWYPVLFGVVYTLFSLFYHLAGGTNHNEKPYIYPALDWEKPGTAVLYCVIVSFVVTPVVHFILFACHVMKLFIHKRCQCCQTADDILDMEMKQPGY